MEDAFEKVSQKTTKMTADCKEETQPTAEAAPVPTIKKDMKTLPIRILEEEVWFSGSELKTDNSSSDEEEGQASSIRARRKTKMVSSSKSSQQTVMTQQVKEVRSSTTKMTMSSSTKIEESTSIQATSSESHPHPMDIAVSSPNICKEYENLIATDGFIDNSQVTREPHALKKIRILEEKILKAEQAYMVAKQETDRFVKELESVLKKTETLENPNWDFFNQLTRKWIQCISNVRSIASYNPIRNRQKLSLTSKDNLSITGTKKSSKQIIKIKKASNYSIVFRNLKQSSKAKLRKNKGIHKLTEAESERLENLLKNKECLCPPSEENDKVIKNPYQFTSLELEKISAIDDKLKFCCGDNSLVTLTKNSKKEEPNFSHRSSNVDDMKLDNDFSDVECGAICGTSAQDEDLSHDEFTSCEDD